MSKCRVPLSHYRSAASHVLRQIDQVVHEVRITNQLLYLHPSMEEARYQIMQQFFAWQAVVTSQNRIQSTRYQVH